MTTVTVSAPTARSYRRIGALITAGFALPWAIGASGLNTLPIVIASLVLTAATATLAFWPNPRQPQRERTVPANSMRRYNWIGAVQFAAIAVVVAALIVIELPMLIPAAVCMIVGLHFPALVQTFDQPQYRWTGVALCAVSAAGAAAYAFVGGEASQAVSGLGAAVVLWATSVWVSRSD